ncbi:hypothetical protein ATO46_02165 [Aeromonas schubertii]|nr:hypothetical protein ATO46_02165 [Aeromonas schubertii]
MKNTLSMVVTHGLSHQKSLEINLKNHSLHTTIMHLKEDWNSLNISEESYLQISAPCAEDQVMGLLTTIFLKIYILNFHFILKI